MARAYRVNVGIDPGFSGAIAFLWSDGSVETHPMPTMLNGDGHKALDGRAIKVLLLNLADYIDMVTIEKAQAMPGQGAVSGAKFVGWQKYITGLCLGLGLPCQEVRPNIWKRDMGLKGGKEGKALSVKAAKKMTGLELTHDAAEAVLIAKWAMGR